MTDDKIEHLHCTRCESNPTYALVDGDGRLVCHCTHDDGDMDPWPVHGFHGHPEEWEFVTTGVDRNPSSVNTDQ